MSGNDDNLAVAVTPPSPDTAVVVLQAGGPASRREVRAFLRRNLSDPAVTRAPAPVRYPLAFALARIRAPAVERACERVGGSPVGDITERQAARLGEALMRLGMPMPVVVGMRYSEPSTASAVTRLHAMGVRRVVGVPLHPQFSEAFAGSAFEDLGRQVRRHAPGMEVVTVRDWADDPGFVRALAATVEDALDRLSPEGRKRPVVLFSARGLPRRAAARGDPYPKRVHATVRAVSARLGDRLPRHAICYQGRPGRPARPGPSTEDAIRDAAARRTTALVLVPVSLVADDLETLWEMDVAQRDLARSLGIPEVERAAALNDSAELASALAAVVARTLASGRRPTADS